MLTLIKLAQTIQQSNYSLFVGTKIKLSSSQSIDAPHIAMARCPSDVYMGVSSSIYRRKRKNIFNKNNFKRTHDAYRIYLSYGMYTDISHKKYIQRVLYHWER